MAARDLWINRRRKFFNKALPRLVFLDETSTNTKLTKRTGWAPRDKRYHTHAPFGTSLPGTPSTNAETILKLQDMRAIKGDML